MSRRVTTQAICVWATAVAAALMLAAPPGAAARSTNFLHHYASGEGERNKPPPQPFGNNARPSQLATLHPDHPLSDEPGIASASETYKTFYPTKIQFNGQHHVRPYKKSHKLKPKRPPPIPPFLSESMTQAIFLDGPKFAASSSSLRRPPTSPGRSKSKTKTERPFPTDPTVASTTTLDQDTTTTYFVNSSLIDLTGDSGGTAVPGSSFKDAASTPSDETIKDYLVPPLPSAVSEYARYNVGSSSSRRPPFKVLRVNGKKKGGGKARFRGPSGSPNLLFGESQKSNVYRSPPMGHPGMGKIPTSYKPVGPNQAEFLRYMMPQASSVVNTPYPRFPPYNFEGENDVVQRPHGKGNKKKQLRPSFPPPEFFRNYNSYMPTTTSTVLVPDQQGWVPIHNPYTGGLSYHPTGSPIRTTQMPKFLGPYPFPYDGRLLPNPSPSPSPMPVYISAQPEDERPTEASNPVVTTSAKPNTTYQEIASSPRNKSTPVTTPSPNRQPETTVEILPSIESPPVSSKTSNPISEFNAEYFLQQALTQVRLQNQLISQTEATRRSSFVSELPNSDEDEVIYQNPVHGIYRDPFVTIHYPVETPFDFPRRQQRSQGLLDVSADASSMMATSLATTNKPSYYDFHLNNIPTAVPPQETEGTEFHYLMSAVKPKVVHEKERSVHPKKSKKAKKPQLRRPTGEPILIYPEPTTPSPEQLFKMSHVTPKTLRGMRLRLSADGRHRNREAGGPFKPSQLLEVIDTQGGLFRPEIIQYHSPVRTDSKFI